MSHSHTHTHISAALFWCSRINSSIDWVNEMFDKAKRRYTLGSSKAQCLRNTKTIKLIVSGSKKKTTTGMPFLLFVSPLPSPPSLIYSDIPAFERVYLWVDLWGRVHCAQCAVWSEFNIGKHWKVTTLSLILHSNNMSKWNCQLLSRNFRQLSPFFLVDNLTLLGIDGGLFSLG